MIRSTTRTRATLAALVMSAGSCVPFPPALAAPPETSEESPFDDARLSVAPVRGPLTLESAAAWVWKRGGTHRIVLNREVRVRIGDTRVTASRADLWLRVIDDAPSRYQIFGVFENMRQMGGAARIEGDLVPIRAVLDISGPIRLRVDARFDAPPEREGLTEFMTRTRRVFRERVLGAGADEERRSLRWPARPYEPSPDELARDQRRTLPDDPAPAEPTTPPRAARDGDDAEGARMAEAPADPGAPRTEPSAEPSDEMAAEDAPETRGAGTRAEDRAPIFTPGGIFSLAIDGGVVVRGARDERPATITADGGITLQYQDPARARVMDMRAERAVVYMRGGETPGSSATTLGAAQISGIYLEGGVFAASEEWSVRSPSVYIDIERDRMLMLDAVFWTVDERRDMPLYFRADEVRQTAFDEFTARNTTIASSSFFEPDLNVGVRRLDVTINREDGAAARGAGEVDRSPRRVFIDGRDVTLRFGSVPFLWLPVVRSDGEPSPLRSVSLGDSERTGFTIRTEWDAFSLFGVEPIPGVDADLNLDIFTERGPAIGLDAGWDTPNHTGSLFSYFLPSDSGTDELVSGREITREDETRGMISAFDLWRLQDTWTLSLQGNFISDEAFVPAFEERRGQEALDFDSFAKLERTDEWTQFSIEVSGSPNDFFAAEHRLVSPGFAVDKIPEVSVTTMPATIPNGLVPFEMTHQSETSIGAMRLRLSEVTAADYGFDTPALAMRAFGTAPGVSLASVQRAAGLDEDTVVRFDTRHELSTRLDAGPVRILPTVVGRVTSYDSSFTDLSPNQGDETRLWGAAGLTLATTLTKVDNEASSELLDIHRIRHIVEPSVTLWAADSNYAPTDTPIFDDDVEGLTRGTQIIAAIDQTWQTKRGSMGRWRDADLLRIRTEIGWADRRAGTSPIPDTFFTRPELSNPGDYVSAEGVFTPTDALGFAGEIVYDRGTDATARSSAGVLLNQGRSLSGSVEFREINALDARFLSARSNLTISEKYTLNSSMNFNFDEGDFQTFNAGIRRRFQTGTLGVTVSFNNIRGDTSIGVTYRLRGTSGGAGFGRGGDFLAPDR